MAEAMHGFQESDPLNREHSQNQHRTNLLFLYKVFSCPGFLEVPQNRMRVGLHANWGGLVFSGSCTRRPGCNARKCFRSVASLQLDLLKLFTAPVVGRFEAGPTSTEPQTLPWTLTPDQGLSVAKRQSSLSSLVLRLLSQR